jgi:EAL domain-containing protein (putative c-di-GMP-specific phosphodiesterase class I)
MQGYRFGAPLSADETAERLAKHGVQALVP